MVDLVVAETPSTDLERVRSRERAVSRVFKGMGVSVVGWLGVLADPVVDSVFGAGEFTQEVVPIAVLCAGDDSPDAWGFGERSP